MTKTLKDILAMQPKTHDFTAKKLEGVKSSTMTDLDGVDPEDSYKSKEAQKFAKQHKIEKHADRVGNGDDVYNGKTKYALKNAENTRMGRDDAESRRVYEELLEQKVRKALGSRFIKEDYDEEE